MFLCILYDAHYSICMYDIQHKIKLGVCFCNAQVRKTGGKNTWTSSNVMNHDPVLDCLHLVLKVGVSPSSQQDPYHLVVAIEAGCFQCCPTNLYGRVDENNYSSVQM